MIPAYPKIYNLGHAYLTDLFADEVLVQEKVDGSYFSFGVIDGKLCCRSKGKQLDMDAPDKMFEKGVAAVKEMDANLGLVPGWVYCGEYLNRPTHNALAYDRVPAHNVILFDIMDANAGDQQFMGPYDVAMEAKRLGLESVPVFIRDGNPSLETFTKMLDRTSVLGGQKIEGVVVKNYLRFGRDGKVVMGKHVSESFREVHKSLWKKDNPTNGDIKAVLANMYRTQTRWNKAIQHLAEEGILTDTPADIGPLMREVNADVLAECSDEIKDLLLKHFWKDLSRELTKGLPEWYKEQLLKKQFSATEEKT